MHVISETLKTTDWTAIGASLLALDLMMFAMLAAVWDEAGRHRLFGGAPAQRRPRKRS